MKNCILIAVAAATFLGGCGHRSIVPDSNEVVASREPAPEECRALGAITGSTASTKGTAEQALEDLKKEAANKGGNLVVVKEYSAYGTSVTGQAFECP